MKLLLKARGLSLNINDCFHPDDTLLALSWVLLYISEETYNAERCLELLKKLTLSERECFKSFNPGGGGWGAILLQQALSP